MPNARHELILTLISEQEIHTQEILRSLLEQNGFQVTQATISRDIRQLGLRKKHSAAGPGYYVRSAAKSVQSNLLADVVIKLDYAINTVVVSCHPGSAQAAGAVLDRMNLEQIVGTIAGDDTIFVLTRSEEQAKALISLLEVRIWG